MKCIIGKKIEMTQKFTEDGKLTPATRVIAGPCVVLEKKQYDNHNAVQLAFNPIEARKVNKALKGFFKKMLKNEDHYRTIKEFKFASNDAMFDKLETGQVLNAGIFQVGDLVKVQGRSKGKGFQGVVKRHGFKGSPASHGHKDQLRMPGSIGATGPAHVFKGTRMGGHMGDEISTVLNLEVLEIDTEKNEILLKGAVPGARHGLIFIKTEGEFEIPKIEEVKPVVEAKKEEVKEVKKETDTVEKVENNEPKVEESKEDKKEEVKPEITKEDKKEDAKVIAPDKNEEKKEEVKE